MSSDTVSPTTSLPPHKANPYTQGDLGRLYLKTAPPVILVMGMGGLLTVIDAVFLGATLGADALTAVTLTFPLQMLLNGVAMAVSSGLSSLLARHLGAGRTDEARSIFAHAHGLCLALGGGLILLFLAIGLAIELVTGGQAGALLAGEPGPIGDWAQTYLTITVLGAPLFFLLSANTEALRDEGRTLAMAGMSLFVSLANIAFNALLILGAGWGVAGSALGTLAAQALALLLILRHRNRVRSALRPERILGLLRGPTLTAGWGSILALGGPRGLNFVGIALVSAAILAAIRLFGGDQLEATVAAYGVVIRVTTFLILPLLGLAQAMQSIVGTNSGAGAWDRADRGLKLGLGLALAYCALAEGALAVFAAPIGALFVSDPIVVGEIARILPPMTALFVATGPLILVATYFQAIGEAKRAALLNLAKPYAFSLPLTVLLPRLLGEAGIWLAAPLAEGLLLTLTLVVLLRSARRGALRWGLFQAPLREARP
jgi:putative MATE family efflux protein